MEPGKETGWLGFALETGDVDFSHVGPRPCMIQKLSTSACSAAVGIRIECESQALSAPSLAVKHGKRRMACTMCRVPTRNQDVGRGDKGPNVQSQCYTETSVDTTCSVCVAFSNAPATRSRGVHPTLFLCERCCHASRALGRLRFGHCGTVAPSLSPFCRFFQDRVPTPREPSVRAVVKRHKMLELTMHSPCSLGRSEL